MENLIKKYKIEEADMKQLIVELAKEEWDANLQGAMFEGANLQDVDFTEAKLEDADLKEAAIGDTINLKG